MRSKAGFIVSLAIGVMMSGCGGGGSSSGGPTPPSTFKFQPPGPPLVKVSSTSPFASGCNGAPQTGVLYTDAEVEPQVTVDPLDPSHIVGAWQQDRWSTGGSQGLIAGVSFDDGKSWALHPLVTAHCAGGTVANGADYERASDPWVSFSPNGVLYALSLSFSGLVFAPDSTSAMLVVRSTDGGMTWSNPVTLRSDGASVLNDKGSITADPNNSNYVYAVWDQAGQNNNGPCYFARTSDGGQTWDPARAIIDLGNNHQTLNNTIVVLPAGTLVNFFSQIDASAGGHLSWTLRLVRSADHGDTWSAATVINSDLAVGARDPETGQAVRDGSGLGSFAVGPGGELYIVWQDARQSNGLRDGILFSSSTDGGLTWSAPVQINEDPSVQAFTPTVHVLANGTIGVTYFDFHDNTTDPSTLPTDYWLAQSVDGVTWTQTKIAGPFDMALAPNAEGLFLGDYQGLTHDGTTFVPFFVQTNNSGTANRTDVYVLPPQPPAPLSRSVLSVRTIAQSVSPGPISRTLNSRVQENIIRVMQQRIPGWPRSVPPKSP